MSDGVVKSCARAATRRGALKLGLAGAAAAGGLIAAVRPASAEDTLAEIKKTGYDGWLTVELYPYIDDPDAAAREAKAFLEKVLSA